MSPEIDEETVDHLAELARLDLGEGEMESLAGDLGEILEHFEKLDELDGKPGVPSRVKNVFREDEVEECLDREEALENAPEAEEGFFVGPQAGGES